MGEATRFVGDLGDIQAKLVRSLAGAGSLGVDLQGNIVPTILVADATVPGNTQFRGKRFAYAESIAAVAAFTGKLVVQNQVAVTIDRLWIGAGTAQLMRIAVVAANVGKPYAPAAVNTRWAEQRLESTDVAPLLTVGVASDAASPGDTLWLGYSGAAQTQTVELLIHLPANSQLILQGLTVNTIVVAGFTGYVY